MAENNSNELQWLSLEDRLLSAIKKTQSEFEFLATTFNSLTPLDLAHLADSDIEQHRSYLEQFAKLNQLYALCKLYDPNSQVVSAIEKQLKLSEESLIKIAYMGIEYAKKQRAPEIIEKMDSILSKIEREASEREKDDSAK